MEQIPGWIPRKTHLMMLLAGKSAGRWYDSVPQSAVDCLCNRPSRGGESQLPETTKGVPVELSPEEQALYRPLTPEERRAMIKRLEDWGDANLVRFPATIFQYLSSMPPELVNLWLSKRNLPTLPAGPLVPSQAGPSAGAGR